jgi:hypothetical protein
MSMNQLANQASGTNGSNSPYELNKWLTGLETGSGQFKHMRMATHC